MDFSEPPEATQIKRALDDFIEAAVEPLESEHPEFLGEDYQRHIVDDDHYQVPEYREIVETIRKKSVEAGFYGMDMPEEAGGGGVDLLTAAIVTEHLANRPPGFHSAIMGGAGGPTPILLACTEEQREEYLYPLMDGEITTCFALTEPDHGSDPHYMDATAEREGDEWVINGEKYWITNGPYADFAMVFARTSGRRVTTGGSPASSSTARSTRSRRSTGRWGSPPAGRPSCDSTTCAWERTRCWGRSTTASARR